MSSIYALLGRSVALLAIVLQGACAQLPEQVDRPVSVAIPSPSGTALEALVQQRRKADGARFESGFLLLGGPPAAYGSRLALIEGARVARFPDLAGWSARDSARRATAEHRACLAAWPGQDPSRIAPLHALGMFFTAARSALFLETLETGSPELPLTVASVARRLEESGSSAGSVAREASESFRAGRRGGPPISRGLISAFEQVVRDLPGFRDASHTS